MNKIFVTIVALFACFLSGTALALYGHFDEFDVPEEEKQINLTIPKGSFFRCFIGETVSSEFNNAGDVVKILVPSDFTIEDKVLLPKNSMFIGVVKNLEKAQRGMDGYFSIDVIGLVFPDGRQFEIKGYVSPSKTERQFGGDFSRRSGHKTTLHRAFPNRMYGVMELQQSGPRIMGKETKILMGTLVNVILEETVNIGEQ